MSVVLERFLNRRHHTRQARAVVKSWFASDPFARLCLIAWTVLRIHRFAFLLDPHQATAHSAFLLNGIAHLTIGTDGGQGSLDRIRVEPPPGEQPP